MFYEVYCELCDKSGLTPSGAASKIGFNRASVTMWKNSGKAPKQDLLVKIADFFGVTTDYLLGQEEKETSPDELTLTEGEMELLELFRLVPVDQQPVVLAMIKAALGRM